MNTQKTQFEWSCVLRNPVHQDTEGKGLGWERLQSRNRVSACDHTQRNQALVTLVQRLVTAQSTCTLWIKGNKKLIIIASYKISGRISLTLCPEDVVESIRNVQSRKVNKSCKHGGRKGVKVQQEILRRLCKKKRVPRSTDEFACFCVTCSASVFQKLSPHLLDTLIQKSVFIDDENKYFSGWPNQHFS